MDQLSKEIISDIYKEFRDDSGVVMLKNELDTLPLTVDEKIAFIEIFRESVIAGTNTVFDLLIDEIKSEARQRKN